MREHGGKIPDGVLRTVVPAAPDAWITALRAPRHDALRRCRRIGDPLRRPRVLRSIRCSPRRSPRTSTNTGDGRRTPQSSCRTTARQGRAKSSCSPTSRARCSTWPTRTALRARTATAGLQAAHDAFYRGDIAREIVAFQQREGGYLTHAGPRRVPLARSSRWCGVRWRGHEVITCGPWCQGPALQEALALLERVGIAGLPHNSADYLHRIAECVNLAMADREYYLRRSGVRRRADRPPAQSGDHRTPRLRRARRPGLRRDAGAARPHQPCRTPAARGAAEGRGRHLVLLRRRSLGQRVQRHAVRRLRQRAGGAGPRDHARPAAVRRAAPTRAIRPAWHPASGRG